MARIDHHIKPYNAGTLNKLELFERYVEAWLPTWIMQPNVEEINIVDFFAGKGYDIVGAKGSPIRILDKINSFFDNLMLNKTIINLYLNEYKSDKLEELKFNCNEYIENHKRLNKFVKVHYSNKDFNVIYSEIVNKTSSLPNLYIIDQSGVRFTNQENFNTLLKTDKTDFLFFISSSFFTRFNKTDEFIKHLDIKEEDLKTNPYKFIHRIVLDKYRSLIPANSNLKIYPFSIRKGANIYGIIFGSKHIRGVEKFLKIAWNKNNINGEADFDIDDDINNAQPKLFENYRRLTKIEWTEETWNPSAGCNKVSAGCHNCYAETMALRLQAMNVVGYENGFDFNTVPSRLNDPLKKKKPTIFFVNSMSDIFHEQMPIDYLDKIFDVIEQTPQHTYQILTKRADKMYEYFLHRKISKNVWLGVTVENNKNGIQRIDKLRNLKASVLFLSLEPLLEDLGVIDLTNIDWVIVGGESGNKARPMDKEWVLNIKQQCENNNVAFFFKQWGTWGADKIKRNKKKNGKEINGEIWQQYPEIVEQRYATAS